MKIIPMPTKQVEAVKMTEQIWTYLAITGSRHKKDALRTLGIPPWNSHIESDGGCPLCKIFRVGVWENQPTKAMACTGCPLAPNGKHAECADYTYGNWCRNRTPEARSKSAVKIVLECQEWRRERKK